MPGSPAAVEGVSRFEMEASVSGVDMERMTAALDWPAFSGSLSGEIPGVRLEDGVLSADGEIRVEVFGGEVAISDLAAERPFGVLPSLSADVVLQQWMRPSSAMKKSLPKRLPVQIWLKWMQHLR